MRPQKPTFMDPFYGYTTWLLGGQNHCSSICVIILEGSWWFVARILPTVSFHGPKISGVPFSLRLSKSSGGYVTPFERQELIDWSPPKKELKTNLDFFLLGSSFMDLDHGIHQHQEDYTTVPFGFGIWNWSCFFPFAIKKANPRANNQQLGGGFKYFLFSSLFGEGFHSDWYFSDGFKQPTRNITWLNSIGDAMMPLIEGTKRNIFHHEKNPSSVMEGYVYIWELSKRSMKGVSFA